MGRNRYSRRLTTESCMAFDSSQMQRGGIFRSQDATVRGFIALAQSDNKPEIAFAYQPAERKLILTYTRLDDETEGNLVDHLDIQIETTPCYYGGLRYWFICPQFNRRMGCQRRTRKLYIPSNCGFWLLACRVCHRLTYRSCRSSHDEERYRNGIYRLFQKYC